MCAGFLVHFLVLPQFFVFLFLSWNKYSLSFIKFCSVSLFSQTLWELSSRNTEYNFHKLAGRKQRGKNGQWKRMTHNPWRSLSLLDGTHAAVQLSLLSSLFFFSTSFLYRRQTEAHGIGTLGYRLIGNPNIDHGRKKSCTLLFSFKIWDNLWNSKQIFITRRNFDLKSTKTYWYVVWKLIWG